MNQTRARATQKAPAQTPEFGYEALRENSPTKRLIMPVLVILIGVAALLYPVASTLFNNAVINQTAAEYSALLDAKADEADIVKELSEAREYNESRASGPILDPWLSRISGDNQNYQEYLAQLNLFGVMARLTVPAINVDLPIFHGTSEEVLTKGVGHLYGSDLPVGGNSMHTVLTAHTGLTTSTLFDNLTDLKVGDSIYVEVYGEKLRYTVTSTEVVLPDETESLVKQNNRDLLTLITCTPYGINSHRLLVHAERASFDPAAQAELEAGQGLTMPLWMIIFISIATLAVLGILIRVITMKRSARLPSLHNAGNARKSGRNRRNRPPSGNANT